MAERSFVKPNASFNAKAQRPLHVRFDLPLLLTVVTLTLFGLLMVYSASWKFSMDMDKAPTYMLGRQIIWVFIGTVAAVVLSFIDYHRYQRFLLPMMGFTALLLVAVLLIRDTRLGADRSIVEGSIRPSELAKFAVIVYLSFWLYSKREVINSFTFGLIPMTLILGGTAALVLGQPDLSAALSIIALGGVLYFLAGGEWRTIVPVLTVIVGVGLLLVFAFPTGRARLIDYWNGLQDPTNASYHVQRALEAVVNGGLFGVGIGRATSKFTGLPVAPTDSIFAIIAEETGLVGSIAVIGLFIFFLYRGMRVAQRAPDLLGRLLAAGLTIWIFLEAVINMGVMVALLPFAGNALPFISAGGSSITIMLASVGIIMNVARKSSGEAPASGRNYSAVVDLRGRNGRRSVSSPVRPSGTR
ncbi:MAG TPA: FtsW/RodA/SpoVE family cell cycle protein [Anaerolineaceae bacterium]